MRVVLMSASQANAFFPTPVQFIVPLSFASLVLGALAYGGWSSGRFIASSLFFALIVALWVFAVWRVRTPSLQINENTLQVRNQLGQIRHTFSSDECELLMTADRIGFRCDDQQEFDLDRNAFSSATWQSMINKLRELPFRSLIGAVFLHENEHSD